jgi:hypothetical protein
MKRMLTCSIVVAGLMAGFVAPAQATVSPANACRFQKLQAGNWTTYEVKVTVRCLAKRMNVDVSHAQYIAYRESRFHRKAISGLAAALGCINTNRSTGQSESLNMSASSTSSMFMIEVGPPTCSGSRDIRDGQARWMGSMGRVN